MFAEDVMAKKNKTVFVCQECGYESSKWMGQCICGAWNSMVEEKAIDFDTEDRRRRTSSRDGAGKERFGMSAGAINSGAGKPVKLRQVSSGEKDRDRRA